MNRSGTDCAQGRSFEEIGDQDNGACCCRHEAHCGRAQKGGSQQGEGRLESQQGGGMGSVSAILCRGITTFVCIRLFCVTLAVLCNQKQKS
jgi:hypothetical protein